LSASFLLILRTAAPERSFNTLSKSNLRFITVIENGLLTENINTPYYFITFLSLIQVFFSIINAIFKNIFKKSAFGGHFYALPNAFLVFSYFN
jgi:hypothetical protein